MSTFVQLFSRGGDDDDHERPRLPPWFEPPEDELGAVVPLALVVGRSERGVVAVSQATGYSTGVTFDLLVRTRDLSEAQASRLFHEQHLLGDDEEPPAGFLRLGLELPSGQRVSNLDGSRGRRALRNPDEEPGGAVFTQHGGGGGSSSRGRVTMRPAFWLWPLPEPTTIRVFCEWPLVGIPLSTAEIDGSALVEAAARSVPLWPSA